MSTRSSIAYVDDGAIHIYSDCFEDDGLVHVLIDGPFEASTPGTVDVVTTRARLAEACRAYLADYANYEKWKESQR